MLIAVLLTVAAGPMADRLATPAPIAAGSAMAAGFDVYFTDEDESPGSVYRYDPATGNVDTVYTRASGRIASFSGHYLPHKLYFVSGSNNDIYRVDNVNGNWQAEQSIFTHGTYVRDIAFLFDPQGAATLYFSESSGGGGDGWVYSLEYGKAVQYFRVRLSEVGGYWAGTFAFDAADTLWLSTGNQAGARLYRVTGGTPSLRYTAPSGALMGFTHLPGAVYYADNDEDIYRVRLSDGWRTSVHSSKAHTRISDVETIGEEPEIPTPTPTRTRTPKPTQVPTSTPTLTPTVVPTSTPTWTPTTVPTSTPTRTHTPVPTAIASPTATTVPSVVPTQVPTRTPTRVPTSTSTATPTTVATVVPSPTTTAVPGNVGFVAGSVALDGRTDHSGATVRVGGAVSGVVSGADGAYRLGPLSPGSHTIDLLCAGYLRAGERAITVEGGRTVELPGAVLLGGETNTDDEIDIVDGAIVSASFGLSGGAPGFDARADINGDGEIDIFDLVMVGNNFGCAVDGAAPRCQRWSDR